MVEQIKENDYIFVSVVVANSSKDTSPISGTANCLKNTFLVNRP
jgi:hypothetical protein